MKKLGLLLFLSLCVLFSCIRRKDFENIKVERWSPDLGLPLINSNLKLDDAVKKNKSELIIQYDDQGFITFVYLDTVFTPTGDWLLNENNYFNRNLPNYHIGDRVGKDIANGLNIAPIPFEITFPSSITNTLDLEFQPNSNLSKVIFKEGKLGLAASLDFQQEVSFTLQIPTLVNASGTPFSKSFQLNPSNNYKTNDTINLAGYTLTAKTGQPDKLDYTLSNIRIKKISTDHVLETDSFKVNIGFKKLKFKLLQGQFQEQSITGIEDGDHNINVFDNVLKGDVTFPDAKVYFTFKNSYGLAPAIDIDSAKMQFSYDKKPVFLDAKSTVIDVPGTTIIPAQTIDQIGQFTNTRDSVTRTNSNLEEVLNGAPYKFSYKVPKVTLKPSAGNNAFITDESQIQIQTKLVLPMFGRVNNLEITDTIKDISLPKPENIDFVQFNFESNNSIPVNIAFQGYFMDSSMTVVLGKLFRNGDTVIVGSGSPIQFDEDKNITKTAARTKTTTAVFNKQDYAKIAGAKNFRIVGRLTTQGYNDVPEAKNVKFFSWQECTFKLSALVTASVPLDNPSSVTDGLK